LVGGGGGGGGGVGKRGTTNPFGTVMHQVAGPASKRKGRGGEVGGGLGLDRQEGGRGEKLNSPRIVEKRENVEIHTTERRIRCCALPYCGKGERGRRGGEKWAIVLTAKKKKKRRVSRMCVQI